MTTMPQPVFILGLQRSGTTWLANMLAALPQVAAVAHADHQGVHESVFFSHFARNFGPWEDPAARSRFVKAFAQSDYFRLTGLEPQLLEDLVQSRQSYGEVFVAVMELFALTEDAQLWIEKSPHHTLLSDDIRRAAPNAKFVMVERAIPDLVASRLHGFGRTPSRNLRFWLDIARATLTASYYRREMRRLARRGLGYLVRYEALKNDPQGKARQGILDYLDLDADPAEVQSAYPPNTSFASQKPVVLGSGAHLLIKAVSALARIIPLGMLATMQQRRDAKRGEDWPDWVWSQTGFEPAKAGADQKPGELD